MTLPGPSDQPRPRVDPNANKQVHHDDRDSEPGATLSPTDSLLRPVSPVSLGPESITPDGRRRLLLIYVHGYFGTEASFQNFPAHVHRLVSLALAKSHVVYTKVYPRYKSRGSMEEVRETFSRWLAPHESESTEVILLGHSLGGIITAEVALLPSGSDSVYEFRHRILGLINFDVPFLGLHPGVISAGLASLFHKREPSPSPQQNASASETTLTLVTEQTAECDGPEQPPSPFDPPVNDPYFNPPFPNDVRWVKRSHREGLRNFLQKNHGHLLKAVPQYLQSYIEHGGVLADYSSLRSRYQRLKECEAVDETRRERNEQGKLKRRIRFVNYYTASPGFPRGRSPRGRSPGERFKQTEDETPVVRLPSPQGAAGGYEERKIDRPATPNIAISPPEPADPTSQAPSHSSADLSPATSSPRTRSRSPLSRIRSRSFSHSPSRSPSKPKKDRKFCALPDDPGHLWVRLFMPDVDEVLAHQTIFIPQGEPYERLVGETVAKIEEWVGDDMTNRMILEGNLS